MNKCSRDSTINFMSNSDSLNSSLFFSKSNSRLYLGLSVSSFFNLYLFLESDVRPPVVK